MSSGASASKFSLVPTKFNSLYHHFLDKRTIIIFLIKGQNKTTRFLDNIFVLVNLLRMSVKNVKKHIFSTFHTDITPHRVAMIREKHPEIFIFQPCHRKYKQEGHEAMNHSPE